MKPTFEKALKPEPKNWVKTSLDPDTQIFQKAVRVRTSDGLEREGSLEVCDVKADRVLVRVNYTRHPGTGQITRDAFFLTQPQMDAFEKSPGTCILDSP